MKRFYGIKGRIMLNNNGVIVYIGGFELPDKNAAAHRVINNCKLLRDIGYKPVLIGISKGFDNEIEPKNCFGFEYYSIKYPNNTKSWVEYLTKIDRFVHIIKRLRNVQKIICYNCPSIVYKKLLKYAKQNKIKIFADITEWYGAQGKNILSKIMKGIDSFYRMRILNVKSDGIIVISDYLKQYYIKKLPTLLLPPLVDINDNKWISDDGTINNHKSEVCLVYSGNPGFKKDKINLIIKALSDIKGKLIYSFSVIGITKEEYLALYPKHKKILDSMNDRVLFNGRVDHFKAINILKKADYSIIVRNKNIISKAGFPTKFVESVTCRVPVIANKEAGLTKYLRSGVNGFLVNVNELSSELKKIILNHNNTTHLSRENIENRLFDYRNYEQIVEDFFRDYI